MYAQEALGHVKRTGHNSWTLIIPKKREATTMKYTNRKPGSKPSADTPLLAKEQ